MNCNCNLKLNCRYFSFSKLEVIIIQIALKVIKLDFVIIIVDFTFKIREFAMFERYKNKVIVFIDFYKWLI